MDRLKKKTLKEQLDFYKVGLAGCKFAEYAAHNPEKHNWMHKVFHGELHSSLLRQVERFVERAEKSDDTSTVSLIFPQVKTQDALEKLISFLTTSPRFFLEPDEITHDFRCVHLRAHIGEDVAWVSGFAPLDFLPKTRQTPYTEIVFRVQKRPKYVKSIQPEPPAGTLHVADMEMPGMSREEFTRNWQQSFSHTQEVLGHHADELSAAKVTFAIPLQK